MESPSNPTDLFMFNVTSREREAEVEGRASAVALARDWADAGAGRICVERSDGRVTMEFRDGALEEYVYETRPARRV